MRNRAGGRSENLVRISNTRLFDGTWFPSNLDKIWRGGHCALNGVLRGHFPGNQDVAVK